MSRTRRQAPGFQPDGHAAKVSGGMLGACLRAGAHELVADRDGTSGSVRALLDSRHRLLRPTRREHGSCDLDRRGMDVVCMDSGGLTGDTGQWNLVHLRSWLHVPPDQPDEQQLQRQAADHAGGEPLLAGKA